MSTLPVRRVLIALAIAVAVGTWVLAFRALWQTSVPGDLALPSLEPSRYFSESKLDEVVNYQAFLRVSAVLAVSVQLAALGLFALKGGRFARESAAGRIGTGMLLGMIGLGIVWLAQFPFSLADHWWQRRHGIALQGYFDWAVNRWLAVGGEFLFICVALLVVMGLAGVWRRRWWVPAAPALAAVVLAYAFVYPYLLPELKPLRDRELQADARALAREQRVEDAEVRVQSTHELTPAPNAEAAGLGPSQRVILWDTLVDRFPRDEVRVVLAHELAHLSRNHIWKGIAWMALLGLPIALAVYLATRRRGGLYEPAAVPVAIFVVAAATFVLTPLTNAFSQRLEREADWEALETTRDPAAATGLFQGFTEVALSDPDPPQWAELLTGTHPSVMERIQMAEAWRARNRHTAPR